jgi:hypothetical protein
MKINFRLRNGFEIRGEYRRIGADVVLGAKLPDNFNSDILLEINDLSYPFSIKENTLIKPYQNINETEMIDNFQSILEAIYSKCKDNN